MFLVNTLSNVCFLCRHLPLPIRQDHEQERPGRLLRRLYRIARRSGADAKLRGQIMGFRTLIEFGA